MSDITVNVPRRDWMDWTDSAVPIELVGAMTLTLFAPNTTNTREYYIAGNKPPALAADRVYFAAHNMLRGYCDVISLVAPTKKFRPWVLHHTATFVALTIPETMPGFRSWRRRWWPRQLERKFENWKLAGVRP